MTVIGAIPTVYPASGSYSPTWGTGATNSIQALTRYINNPQSWAFSGGVNAIRYGADPTGGVDSAPAIAAAIADAAGGLVILPPGGYLWGSSQTVTVPAIVQGFGWNERNNSPGTAATGTWIKITDSTITPLTYSGTGVAGLSGFRDCAFEQTHAAAGVGWTPTAYNPIFKVSSVAGQLLFDNLYFYNIYAGISVPGSLGTNGRINVGNTWGQTFSYLFDGSCILDVVEFGKLHLWAFWDDDTNVLSWQQANGIPLRTERCDGILCDGLFALGYQSPFKFAYDSTNSPNGPTTNARFGAVYADACKYGGWLTGSGASVFIGTLSTEGGAVTGSYGFLDESSGSHTAIRSLNMLGSKKNAVAQTNASNGSTIKIGTAYIQEYNGANDGSTAFHQTNTAGIKHVMELGTTPAIGSVTNAAALINNNSNIFIVAGTIRTNLKTVAALPSAATVGSEARSYVTDANATTYGSVVAGGGANAVTVYSDATNWRIG